jgi:hypothetical protein
MTKLKWATIVAAVSYCLLSIGYADARYRSKAAGGPINIERGHRMAPTTWISTTTSMPNTKVLVTKHAVSSYWRGAAHPVHGHMTENTNLQTGKKIKLRDLFKPRSGYTRTISRNAIKALKRELGPGADATWIRDGAGANLKNFESFAITRKGLELNFSSYQVACYAAGTPSVVVPWKALKSKVRHDSPIWSMIKND